MQTPPSTHPARAPYVRPTLEVLGAWSALTLQQTIPVTSDLPIHIAFAPLNKQ